MLNVFKIVDMNCQFLFLKVMIDLIELLSNQ